MAKIVLIWEMGADLGHITRLDMLATHLSHRGHNVTAIFSDMSAISEQYPDLQSAPYRLLQGPSWSSRRLRLSRSPANLSEVLLSVGFYQPQIIADKLVQWQALLAQLQADVIIYDYAPTALLATRTLNCHKINLSDPFSNPPACVPLPLFARNANVSDANLSVSENKLIHCINQATYQTGLMGIQKIHELFSADQTFLLSIPELDPFAHLRSGEKYIGAFANKTEKGIPLQWKKLPAKKVFAYLKPSWPNLGAFLTAVSQLAIQGRFFIPGAPDALLNQYCKADIEIVTSPYELSAGLENCDLTVCHGGHSTLLQSVLNGTPALLVPLQQEQQSIALRAVDSALGQTLAHDVGNPEVIVNSINNLLQKGHLKRTAQSCADYYCKHFSKPAIDVVTEHVESLL